MERLTDFHDRMSTQLNDFSVVVNLRRWSLNKQPCHGGGSENSCFMCIPVMVLTAFLTRTIMALKFGFRWTWSSGGALARLVWCVRVALEDIDYGKVRVRAPNGHVWTFGSASVSRYLGLNSSLMNHWAWNQNSILSLSLSFFQYHCWFSLMFGEWIIVKCRFIRFTFACLLGFVLIYRWFQADFSFREKKSLSGISSENIMIECFFKTFVYVWFVVDYVWYEIMRLF